MKHLLLLIAVLTFPIAAKAEDKKITTAEHITQAGPYFPPEMQARKMSGKVTISMDIDKTGRTMNCKIVSSSDPGFNASALDYCKVQRYVPAFVNGKLAVEHNHKQTLAYSPGQ
ncbi:energy transducer TonB [Gluconobacter morbifer]|uniref:energy transducer TonB n=1 Tax=Gluconobacter morbifer TaxID=479935 RepID=UPI00058FC88B|nr:energy transducer TonB [Gluconobacter morbifer]